VLSGMARNSASRARSCATASSGKPRSCGDWAPIVEVVRSEAVARIEARPMRMAVQTFYGSRNYRAANSPTLEFKACSAKPRRSFAGRNLVVSAYHLPILATRPTIMNHIVVVASIFSALALAATADAQTATTQAPDWTAETDTPECFGSNANGVRIAPCAGWVKTKQNQLQDFVFEFDWRAVAPNTNAVLALFGVDGRGRNRWASAYGLSLFGQSLQSAVAGPVRMMPISIDPAKVGEALKGADHWEWYSISRTDDRLRVSLNGITVATTSTAAALDGWIAFRVAAGVIEIRGMRVAIRPPSSQPRMLARGGFLARSGNGVVAPKVRYDVRPEYTGAALSAKIEGVVVIEVVVDEKGQVTDPIVVRSLDDRFGLDAAAIEAAKKWRFQPGTYQGKPVPVVLTLEMAFTLR
jgi:TonB family protein